MDAQVETTLGALHARHIKGVFSQNLDEGRNELLKLIPLDAIVGIGDSTTIRQMGILPILTERGTRVLDAFGQQEEKMDPKDIRQRHAKIVAEATICDVFLTGTNAITQDGRLINVDAVGNRVAGMVWGHPISVIVVGRNKIVRDLSEAFHRIRNIIAPNHARIRSAELGGGEMNTPCVKNGECVDCRASDRICNVFTIIEGKPFHTNLVVVIVNEDLGLGWDPCWDPGRIKRIIEEYKKFVWLPPRNNP